MAGAWIKELENSGGSLGSGLKAEVLAVTRATALRRIAFALPGTAHPRPSARFEERVRHALLCFANSIARHATDGVKSEKPGERERE